MEKKNGILFLILVFSLALTGCVVRTYPLTKDRVDQDISGNRGYLKGGPGYEEPRERKVTRTTQAVEIELRSPIKFESMPKAKPVVTRTEPEAMVQQDTEIYGNRGYITESIAPEIREPVAGPSVERYTVQKSDTLQKISQRFYGTTKQWPKILRANKAALKSPNRIYPGQVLNIPIGASEKEPVALKKPRGNLK